MTYKLFIDDERNPVTDDWIVVRSSWEAYDVIVRDGMPVEIAFDHDLGGDDTAMRFLWRLSDYMERWNIRFPRDFTYSIHSQNPVGARNIQGFLDGMIANFGRSTY
jgi:hypothetical protein